MVKKWLIIALIIAILFFTRSCWSRSDDNVETTDPTTSTVDTTSPIVQDPIENETKKGLPVNYDSIDYELQCDYKSKALNALFGLDFTVLEEYVDSNTVSALKAIKENQDYCDMYLKTIGLMKYLPQTNAILAKETNYVFDKWYTDLYRENAPIPVNNPSEFDMKTLNELYGSCYNTAPYTIYHIEELTTVDEGGVLKFNLGGIFKNIISDSVQDLKPGGQTNNCAKYMFGYNNNAYKSNGYKYISRGGAFVTWEAIYNFDIDALDQVLLHNQDLVDKNLLDMLYYQEYYLKRHTKPTGAIDWIVENCEILRNGTTVTIYAPGSVRAGKYVGLSSEEKNLLKEYDICETFTFEHEPYDKQIRGAIDIIKYMENIGVVDKLTFSDLNVDSTEPSEDK